MGQMIEEYTDAAVLTAIGHTLSLQKLKVPEPKQGQVLVQVIWSALCHSQLNEIRGRKGPDPYLPHTLGHEGSGIVLATGKDVSKVEVGDPVVLTWIPGDGLDAGPSTYEGPDGPVNSGPISTFLRTSVISENRVIRIDPDMPMREAALFGCAIPTGFGMAQHDAAIKPGESVAVFGVGGIGLAALTGAVAQDAAIAIAIDRSNEKLDRARRLGATHTVNAAKVDPVTAIQEIVGASGLDVAIEAVGSTEVIEQAFSAIHTGGRTVIAGNPPSGDLISLDPMELIKGKSLLGTSGGGCNPEMATPDFHNLYKCGKLPLEDMITHEYPLNLINRAFDDLEQGRVGRALINMAEDAEYKVMDAIRAAGLS